MANDFPETAVRFAVLRSKHRRRLRRSAWAVGAFLLLGVGGFAVKYAWLSVRYWSQHPRLSRNFTAELNAKVDSVPEAERAWPRYRELLTKIDNRLPSEFYASDEYLRTADQPRARAIAALKRNRELLPRLREIASMPNLGFPLKDAHDPADFAWMQRLLGDNLRPSVVKQPSDNPKLIETLLPYADALRAFARMLTLDAELAMEQNDGQAVTDDIIACLGIADQFLSCPLALDDMLSWSVLGNATGLLRWCVSENSALFSDDQLQRISDRLSVYNRGLPIVPRIDTEYFAVEDMVQRLYSDNGKGDGIFLPHLFAEFTSGRTDRKMRLMAPFTVDRYASRREVLALCRVLREKATLRSRQPLWQCTRLPNDDIAEMSEKDRVRLPLIYVFLPSTSNHYLAAQQASQVHDATLTVLALIRFKLRHGNWPKALGDLIPAFLEEVPLDRFTGVPLGYCIVRGGPLLYSFGPDRDNDGGTAPASGVEQLVSIWAGPKRMHSAATIDGDWILWPSPHRPVFEESPFPAR